jgi:hypothetical protein
MERRYGDGKKTLRRDHRELGYEERRQIKLSSFCGQLWAPVLGSIHIIRHGTAQHDTTRQNILL